MSRKAVVVIENADDISLTHENRSAQLNKLEMGKKMREFSPY